ncbi:CRISPR system precrRNA processing endoribonuclease RAMP protein Cas6 [[Phormidium ambiguum] IAM M-71]|uniref:CRISPR system precrRNA processing endoribonuclease RAMP protein Cas6 n=1 Tax=[Phormidium ambiguum] IAM M-71 TaxID=454136 RepID=UPI000A03F0E8|nr:CRISPR system precrRNA processing endoribonuclease RAMP protein Cas6 [Phormidium ambiguum]
MIYTSENELPIAGLSLVLQPTNSSNITPLQTWLSDIEPLPIWIPLVRKNGVNKVLAVASHSEQYAEIIPSIFGQISQRTAVQWQGQPYELTGVEIDRHELHIVEISLLTSEPLPPSLGRAIHALCFHWLATADAALAEQLHNSDLFPFTLVVKPGKTANQLTLRISILQRELLAPLLWGMSQDMGSEITLTNIPCRLGNWVNIQHSTSFAALAQVPSQNTIELQFLSPTSFKQEQVIQPFPLPELVFSSLWRKWNALASKELQLPEIEWQGFTAAYELQTVALKMKGVAEIGAKGWVRYQFPNSTQAQIATTLAHFATFAGVGRKTAMGMGQAKIIQGKL